MEKLSSLWITLAAIFAILKICGLVDWSWFWVLSPVWLPLVPVVSAFALIIGTLFIVSIGFCFFQLVESILYYTKKGI